MGGNSMPTSTNPSLNPHQHRCQNCVYVSELSENVATSIDDVMGVMVKGLDNRHIGETKMNDKSSRSHSIFRVVSAVYT